MIRFFAALGGLWVAFYVLMGFICTKMFEYSLFVVTGREVPWYLDLLGGLVLNGLNFPIWVFCLIYSALGYPTPIV